MSAIDDMLAERVTRGSNSARALMLAAHEGQTDKAGQPYRLHCIAVANRAMLRRAKGQDALEVFQTGLLHDAMEDGRVSWPEIRTVASASVADAVQALTRRAGESRPAYLDRIKADQIAVTVKLADLSHNMELDRLPVITPADIARTQAYVAAYAELLNHQRGLEA